MSLVKWVQKYNLRDGPQPIETGPVTFVPVLTLDQIEAWLGEVRTNGTDDVRRSFSYRLALADLLAQVQAWRGELIPKQDSGSKQGDGHE